MENNKYNINSDEFIAKWMSGDLNAEEMKAFESHPNYNEYVKIKTFSNQLSFSDFDKKKAFSDIQEKTKPSVIDINRKPKSSVWKYVMTGAAAAVLLLVGLFFNTKNTTFQAGEGAQVAFQLPDDSEVLLNGNSKVSFSKKQWKKDRLVDLEGEAYFKVTKGQKFTVKAPLGQVQVLGTQFTVNSLGDSFIVKCYEGRVGVTSGGVYKEITPGIALQIRNGKVASWQFEDKAPLWVTNATSSFRKIPVTDLITAFKRQYKVDIIGQEVLDTSAIFTGSFPNNNLDEAIKVIFNTLGVAYKLEGNAKIVILKE